MTSLLLIPGLGADRRLFEPQRVCAADLHVIDWIAPAAPDEPLRDYVERLATTFIAAKPLVLGGASFGGVVALELAHHLEPAAVVLLGSWRAVASLPRPYRTLAAMAPALPVAAIKRLLAGSSFVASRFGVDTPAQRRLFGDMLRSTPSTFLRWGGRAILDWAGETAVNVPVHHIHGAEDRIIPCRRVRADAVVPGAGHLLSLTHPAEVNAFLDAVLSRVRADA